MQFEVPTLPCLFHFLGSSGNLVTGITINGLTLTGAASTLFYDHITPSGGDWGIASGMGAILLEYASLNTISYCLFTRIDGNGVFLNGWNVRNTVYRNEFNYVSESGIVSLGYTDPGKPWSVALQNQPINNTISYNLCHEMGYDEKQISCYFQAISGGAVVENNIFYNIPRAGFNFNDGAPPGGTIVRNNLGFNTCSESQDHGPFNSWSRVPYIGADGSSLGAFSELSYNFLVANYGANGGSMDNDDGSSRYRMFSNFWVYGGHKSDFDGNQKLSYNNVMAFANVYGPVCMGAGMTTKGSDSHGVPWSEGYFNNTCILSDAGSQYLSIGSCSPVPADFNFIVGNNSIYAPNADVVVDCGSSMSFQSWIATGIDVGTTVHDLPSSQQIIAWGAAILNMPQSLVP
jgi:hypothetical protein